MSVRLGLQHERMPWEGETARTTQADKCRKQIDIEHLVVRAHVVALEQLVLKSGREAIKAQIAQHESKAPNNSI